MKIKLLSLLLLVSTVAIQAGDGQQSPTSKEVVEIITARRPASAPVDGAGRRIVVIDEERSNSAPVKYYWQKSCCTHKRKSNT